MESISEMRGRKRLTSASISTCSQFSIDVGIVYCQVDRASLSFAFKCPFLRVFPLRAKETHQKNLNGKPDFTERPIISLVRSCMIEMREGSIFFLVVIAFLILNFLAFGSGCDTVMSFNRLWKKEMNEEMGFSRGSCMAVKLLKKFCVWLESLLSGVYYKRSIVFNDCSIKSHINFLKSVNSDTGRLMTEAGHFCEILVPLTSRPAETLFFSEEIPRLVSLAITASVLKRS